MNKNAFRSLTLPRIEMPILGKASLEHTARNQQIASVCTPLPGKTPYENKRPISVTSAFSGLPLLDFLEKRLPHKTRQHWENLLEKKLLFLNDQPAKAKDKVMAGNLVVRIIPNTIEPEVNVDIQVFHEDAALMAVSKPAPLPVHPSGRFNKNTLTFILGQAFLDLHLRLVHRLDANTTGILLLAKTKQAASELVKQFESRKVEKQYLARANGIPNKDTFSCDIPIEKHTSVAGTRQAHENGLPAFTSFQVIGRLKDETSLIVATPKSGRTNQIRIHLAETGFPILGDAAYGENAELSKGLTGEDALCLHAWKLTFEHPTTKKIVTLETKKPNWAI